MSDYNVPIFRNKKLSDIFEEIYKNRRNRDRQITGLIAKLEPLLDNINDAIVIVPLIKDYLDIGVKNDEHLIKLATIVQRMESKKMESTEDMGLGSLFSEDELRELENEIPDNNILDKELEEVEIRAEDFMRKQEE